MRTLNLSEGFRPLAGIRGIRSSERGHGLRRRRTRFRPLAGIRGIRRNELVISDPFQPDGFRPLAGIRGIRRGSSRLQARP